MNDHNTTRTLAALALLLCGCIAEVEAPELPAPIVAPVTVTPPPDAGGPAFAVCGVEKPCNCGALAWKCCLPFVGSSACTCIGPSAVTDEVQAETTAQCAELRAP